MEDTQKEKDVQMLVRIPAPLATRVRSISQRTGIPLATLVEQALQGKLADFEEVAKKIENIKQ